MFRVIPVLYCLAVLILAGSQTMAMAQGSGDDFWDRVDRDVRSIDEFTGFANRTDTTTAAVMARADSLIRQLDASMPYYRQHPVQGGGLDGAASVVVGGIGSYLTGLKDYRRAYAVGDRALFSRAVDAMNAGLADINRGFDSARRADEAASTEQEQIKAALYAGTGVSVLLSLALFVLGTIQKRVVGGVRHPYDKQSSVPLVLCGRSS